MNVSEGAEAGSAARAGVRTEERVVEGAEPKGFYHFEAYAPVWVGSDACDLEAFLADLIDRGLNVLEFDARGRARLAKAEAEHLCEVFPFIRIVERENGGDPIWVEDVPNLVTNAGEDEYLDVTLAAGTQNATWYVLLTDGTPTVAEGDTMASHAGWAEVTAYSEASRPTWSPGAVSGQSVDNSGSPASFSINASATIGGAGMVADNTKGGTTGPLLSVAAFTNGDRSLQNGDTLEVTITQTMGGS